MKIDTLEAALHKRPFSPFEMRVDGETILLKHPDQAIFADHKSTVAVVDEKDKLHILDVDSISKLTVLPRPKASRKS